MKILCVCLGNICRSPTAEAVLKHMLGEGHRVNSAGTSAWHEGNPPDGRSTYHAALRGYSLEGVSRAVRESDFEDYDLILAMDASNHFDLIGMCPNPDHESKIKLLTDFCKIHEADRVKQGVPDPYYDGEKGFGVVLDIIEDACHEIVLKIKSREI